MKKVISLVMALVMMLAVMVPAFAADQTVTTAGQYTADVKTTYVDGDASFSVSYPATMDLEWGAESTEFTYTVTSQLKANQAVNVKIADFEGGFNLVSGANQIPYAINGVIDGTTSAPVVTGEVFNFTVDVAEADWKAAAIDTYADTVTFTVAVVGA